MNSIRTQLRFPDKQVVKCTFKPCKPLSNELGSLLQQDVVESLLTWSYAAPESNNLPRPAPLAVAHALAGDRGPDVRLSPDPEDASSVAIFEEQHKLQLEAQQTMVVRFDPKLDKELVLVPVKVKTGQKSTAGGYWGYVVPSNLLNMAATVLHYGRLVVVFDLDETLLMAHTVDSLQARIRRVNAAKEAKAAEIQSLDEPEGTNAQQIQQLSADIQLLEAEGALLQQDFEMLDSYRRDLQCRVYCAAHSRTYEPRWERVRTSKGDEVSRPVVRMEIDGRPLIFTRINPDSKSTSVLVRPRPNWQLLKDYLSGIEDVRQGLTRKQRFDVYICTTAEREYALEAWRLLDPEGSVFPLEQLVPRRMLCVPHPAKKDLLNVLRWEQIYVQMVQDPKKPPSILVTDEGRALKGPDPAAATLSVIVDDRADVWEDISKKDLLQVMPFHPHKEAACDMLGPGAAPQPEYQASRESDGELLRVVNTLRELRSKFYTELDHHIKPEAQRLMTLGVSEALQANPTELLPPMTLISELLATSQCKPPAALGLTEREDRASDLRLLANDHTMTTMQQQQEAAAAANGAVAAGVPTPAAAAAAAVGGVPVSDPRKRRAAAAGAAAAPAQQQQQQKKVMAAEQPQQQQQPVFDFAGGIQGLLASLQGATAPSQQQQQQSTPPAAAATAQDADQPVAKKRKLASKPERQQQQQLNPAAAPDDTAAAAAAAGTPGLNNSIGDPTNSGPHSDSLVTPSVSLVTPAQVSLVTPQHPMVPLPDPGLHNRLPGPPVPPGHVIAVLRAAAAAGRSPNDLAAYNEMFPAVLRSAASPGELLEVLACLSAQYKYSVSHESSIAALKAVLGEDKFRTMQKVAGILNGHADAAMFLKPIMDASPAAAAPIGLPQQQQQQQQQPVLVDMRSEIDLRNLGGPAQQQQQFPIQSGPASGANLVLLPGPPAAAAAPHPQIRQQQQQQLDPYGPLPNPQELKFQQQDGVVDWGPPTREKMLRLGNDPDCFNYDYPAMCAVSRTAHMHQICAENKVKSPMQLLTALNRDMKGPRVTFEIYQGDKRPGSVQHLKDPNFSCVIKYWGKEWGYGYGNSKKVARQRAAEEAAANMYVSGVNLGRIPAYTGPRPAAAAAGAISNGPAAAAAAAATTGSHPGGGVMQAGGSNAVPAQPAAGVSGQIRPPQQQQQGGPSSAPPAAAAAAAAGPSSRTAVQELQHQYGDRVKYDYVGHEPNKNYMTAALHETIQKSSRIQVGPVTGEAFKADEAVEDAARQLLVVLAQKSQLQQQQQQQGGMPQQQQQQGGIPQQQHQGLPPWRAGNAAAGAAVQQQQQQQRGFPSSGPGSGSFGGARIVDQGFVGYDSQNPGLGPAVSQGLVVGGQFGAQAGVQGYVNLTPPGFGAAPLPYNPPQQQQQQQLSFQGGVLPGPPSAQGFSGAGNQQQQQFGGSNMQGRLQGRVQGM